jgi:hypothetical protein
VTNLASGLFRDGRSFPTRAQMLAAVELYDKHASRGLEPNSIADAVGWTRGTAAVVRRWSLECAAGYAPAVEIPPSVRPSKKTLDVGPHGAIQLGCATVSEAVP